MQFKLVLSVPQHEERVFGGPVSFAQLCVFIVF